MIHPIGRCIFVFAGGTSHKLKDFNNDLANEKNRKNKLPDFISRLKGFLNVIGPNPIGGIDSDPYYVLRRAVNISVLS